MGDFVFFVETAFIWLSFCIIIWQNMLNRKCYKIDKNQCKWSVKTCLLADVWLVWVTVHLQHDLLEMQFLMLYNNIITYILQDVQLCFIQTNENETPINQWNERLDHFQSISAKCICIYQDCTGMNWTLKQTRHRCDKRHTCTLAHIYASVHAPTHPHTPLHTQCMWIFSCMFTTPFSHSFKTVHRQRKYPDYKYQIYLLLIAFVLGCALENKEGKPSMIVYAYFTCASMYRANPPTPWSSLSITWLWTAPPPRPFCDRAE